MRVQDLFEEDKEPSHIYDILMQKMDADVPIYLTKKRAKRATEPMRIVGVTLVDYIMHGSVTKYIRLNWAPEIDGEIDLEADAYDDFSQHTAATWKISKSQRGMELTI